MTAVGMPSLDLREPEIDAVISVFLTAARRARPRVVAAKERLETRISTEIDKEFDDVQRELDIEIFEFQNEYVLTSRDAGFGKTLGRVDFALKMRRHVGRKNAYFGVECKRVTAADGRTVSYFVGSGIGKYAKGTYGRGHANGMLVGYVLDPPRAAVVALIDRLIQREFGTQALVPRPGRLEPDAEILEGDVDRDEGPIRLVHLYVQMHA